VTFLTIFQARVDLFEMGLECKDCFDYFSFRTCWRFEFGFSGLGMYRCDGEGSVPAISILIGVVGSVLAIQEGAHEGLVHRAKYRASYVNLASV